MKAKNIHVTKRHDNQWQGIGEGNIRPYFVAETQKQAQQKAREIALERKVEVASSKTGGYIYFCPIGQKCKQIWLVVPAADKSASSSRRSMIASTLLFGHVAGLPY